MMFTCWFRDLKPSASGLNHELNAVFNDEFNGTANYALLNSFN